MPKLELCKHTGCKKTTPKGYCWKHRAEGATSGKSTTPKSSTSRKDPILEQLLKGKVHTVEQPEISPIGTSKGGPGEKPKDGTSPPPRGPPVGTMPVSPGLFLLIGHRLDKVFETDDFGLDEEEATYLARTLGDSMTAHGGTADPMYMLLIALVLWLLPGLVKHMPEKWKSLSKEGQPAIEKKEGLLSQLPPMMGRRTKKKEKVFENTLEPPIEPTLLLDQTPPPPAKPVLEVNPKWKQTDLTAMEKESRKKLKIST